MHYRKKLVVVLINNAHYRFLFLYLNFYDISRKDAVSLSFQTIMNESKNFILSTLNKLLT